MKKINWILIAIVIAGVFFRLHQFDQLFYYSHDHDLIGWFIRDILENGHLRLIGQETSQHGVFIGPLFYYLLIPFYALGNMDPIAGIWLPILIAIGSMISVYFVFSRIWNTKTGLIGSFIYAFSFNLAFTDREVVPTTPVMLWSIWFLYSLHLIKQGKQKYGFLLGAILIGLIWHINLALALVLPLLVLAFVFSKKRLDIKSLSIAIILCVLINLPLIAFEARHDFQQTKAVLGSLTGSSGGDTMFSAKLDRTMQLVYKNTDSIFFNSFRNLTLLLLIASAIWLIGKKVLSKQWVSLFTLWVIAFIVFFSLNKINLSEYYLNGMNIVWIAIASLLVSTFLNKSLTKWLGITFLVAFALMQVYRFASVDINESGYLYRKAIINHIKEDSVKRGYPCVSLSFITSPGSNLGYRYFTYLSDLKTKPVSENVPVYTIVFPHTMVDRIDNSFGALGLVLPDYKRYNIEQVSRSCEGDNVNLTESMFGFTN